MAGQEQRRGRVSAVRVRYGSAPGARVDDMGMRPMQARAWKERGAQYLLIKSPPASGKSRALMFIALDKIRRQGLKKAIVVVPERFIGASFNSEQLSAAGFPWDWRVAPRWNLCNAPGGDSGKVAALGDFLGDEAGALAGRRDEICVCTHATFRFAMDRFGAEAFDDCLVAVDEFHHVSANPDSKLGQHVGELIARGKTHLVAMTGSYFRGDAEAVLLPEDEARFKTVTYTYHEQLGSHEHLKSLDMGYFFYQGQYLSGLEQVLDPARKTIIHIPHVAARESTGRKHDEVGGIFDSIGAWQGTDPATGFDLVRARDGRVLRVANLVDDNPAKREKVSRALKDPAKKHDRDHVDVIVALGMAKEGFDWIWCEHALTIGHRASLTEIVQIIGRATRDAPGKRSAQFTNLIAEPDASQEDVTEAVNDTIKAIAASLLMEQVLAPKFEFAPRHPGNGDPGGNDDAADSDAGRIYLATVDGLTMPTSKEGRRIIDKDLDGIITDFIRDSEALKEGIFKKGIDPRELTQGRMGAIVAKRYPHVDAEDRKAIAQHAVALMHKRTASHDEDGARRGAAGEDGPAPAGTSFVDQARKFVDVRDLDIDMIERINPFGHAYAVIARAMDENVLKQVEAAVADGKEPRVADEAEARALVERAVEFQRENGFPPSANSLDPWERRMAQGVLYMKRKREQELARDEGGRHAGPC